MYQDSLALAAFSQALTATSDFDQILEAVGRYIEGSFHRRSIILLPVNGFLRPGFRSAEFVFGESELAKATWLWRHGQDAGRCADILSAAQPHYLRLKARGQIVGMLCLEVKPGSVGLQYPAVSFSTLSSVNPALAIERALSEQKGRRLRFLEESDKVQKAVLMAISHDVRAPLAAITASLSGLLTANGALNRAAERQLLETAETEARRLHHLVNNLLSMTRLETGASTVKTEPADLVELVGAALGRVGDIGSSATGLPRHP